MKKLIVLAAVTLLAGCTDATISGITSLGSPADITCYSGNMVIYHGRSTGKVATVENSDGWEFRDAATQRFVRVSGPCVVLN
jgi:uncharacterized lipoprotein YajG